MDLQLSGRTALVTGASAGIGAGIVRMLAREGVAVAAVARRVDKLQALAAELRAEGLPEITLIEADLMQRPALPGVAQQAMRSLGAIDILVNCAGASRPIGPDDGDAVWDDSFALNFTAARKLTEAVLPAMRERRWGRIISISGLMEPRARNAATVAKAALHLWAKGLSCEVAADGITVNTVEPGRINSEQILQRLHPTEEARRRFIEANIPIGYFGEPEDLAALVVFLASPVARYITGTVIPVDGGMQRFGA